MAIHVGLIGAGNISDTHARAAKAIPGVEIAAVYGRNAERVRRLSAEHGGVPYGDWNAFLRHRPMEMVMVGSPSGMHAAHGIDAARRGLHVLVEKPMEISTARADALIAECRKAQVQLGVIFQDRMNPDICRLKQFIESGALGKLLQVDARVKWYRPPEYYSGSRWRGTRALDGGGALMNQGSHTVDLLLWLLGDVTAVQARTATALHAIETEDTAMAILEFLSGALGVLQATTAAYPGYPRRVEITGSEGTVVLEHDQVIAADLRTRHEGLISAESSGRNSSSSSPVVSDIRGHQRVLEDFIRAVEQNRAPVCDGVQGRRSVAVIQAIYEAARNGPAVVAVHD